MNSRTNVGLGVGWAVGVMAIACSGGEQSGASGVGGRLEDGGHSNTGTANRGGVSSVGGSAVGTRTAATSGGTMSSGTAVSTQVGSGGVTVGPFAGGASTSGHSFGAGGTLTGSGGAATAGLGGASGGASAITGGKTASSGTGGTAVGTGGANVGSGGTGSNATGTGSTKNGSGGSGGATTGTGGNGGITSSGSVTILPGAVWNDTQGNVLQAHGEGITKVGSTYYLLGEDKTNGAPFQNVKCYSSTDLKNWTFVNNVLTRQASGDLGPNRIIERPHVIYNASTSQYVMYMHVDSSSYGDRKAGVATCSSVCGNYTYKGSIKPLGHDSLDDTLFQDGATGYFISEDRTNTKLQIYQLADDYLTVSSLVASLPQYESPAVVKIASTYYIFGSHLTGWSTNDNQYSTASSMAGPWAAWKSFAPSGTNTCNSQVTFILPVTGTGTTTYVFFGDRWNSNNLTDSRYVWQPLTITGTVVSMTCATSWKIDTATGTWNL